jgi:hypothetical protein
VGTERGPSLVVAGGVSNLLRGGDTNPDWVANVVMLLPMGILLPSVTGWGLSRTVLSCLAFSAWIEAVQYVCTVGCPELIDVVLNTLGAAVGYGIWALVTAARRQIAQVRWRGGLSGHYMAVERRLLLGFKTRVCINSICIRGAGATVVVGYAIRLTYVRSSNDTLPGATPFVPLSSS